MNNIPNEILKYNIIYYLDFKSIKVLNLVNKIVNKYIQNINYRNIGFILINKLGFKRTNFIRADDYDSEVDDDELIVIEKNSDKINMIKEMSKVIEKRFFVKSNKKHLKCDFSSISHVKAGILFSIIYKTKEECIYRIENEDDIFRRHKNNANKNSYIIINRYNRYIRDRLPLAFSLLLAPSIQII